MDISIDTEKKAKELYKSYPQKRRKRAIYSGQIGNNDASAAVEQPGKLFPKLIIYHGEKVTWLL